MQIECAFPDAGSFMQWLQYHTIPGIPPPPHTHKSTQEEVLKESLFTFSWISGEADTRNITC